MRIHLLCALLVCGLSYYCSLNAGEWAAVLLCIALVMIAEIVNTAIEKICDLVSLERREEIRYIKDISAGGVLIACTAALVVGLIVFIPYMLAML